MLIDFRKLFPRWNIKPSGVLHLGANVGEEAPVYHELGIDKVIWVEGNPEIYTHLSRNLTKYPGQHAYNFLVGNKNEEEVTLHVSNNGSQSSSVLELGTHKTQHPDVHYTHDVKVKMNRVEDYFFNSTVIDDLDFLNLDLQGYEMEALRGMGDLLFKFKWIYTEVNKAEVYQGCPHVNDLDLFLNSYKFKRVETAHWIGDWSDALYIQGR